MAYILKNGARPNGSEVRNIKVGDSEIKYIITGEGSLFYDIQHYIEYDIPELTFLYPDEVIPAEGGKLKPSVQEFKQKWRRVGYSGNKYEQEIIIEGADIQYHVLSGEDITVDEFGEIEWKSRGINFDENERIAVIQMTVIINGQENYITATVRQAKNIIEKIDYNEPSGLDLITSDIPASGGIITEGYVNGTIVQTRTDTYSSKELDIYKIYPHIINDYYSEPVTADSLEANIKKRSIVGNLTYYYNCNGVIGSCSSDVYQQANVIEVIEVDINTLQYEDIKAGDTLTTPITQQSPRFIYTSETYSIELPDSQYGTLVEQVSYSLSEYINGFTSCDWQTGELYATSRGTIYGSDYRTSGMVTKLVLYTWQPITSEYGNFVETSGSITAFCNQEPNFITKIELVDCKAGSIETPSVYLAKEETKTINNITSASSGCLVTFSSNESTYDFETWIDLNINYTWITDQNYVQLVQYDDYCNATMLSRGIDYDTNSRTATITRIADISAVLKPAYIYAESVYKTVDCSIQLTQNPNTIKITNIIVNPGIIDGPDELYLAKGEIKTIYNSEDSTAFGTLKFDSEEEVAADITYGSWSGPVYTWISNKDYAICSNTNASADVEMINRTNVVGAERSASITRHVDWTYTLDPKYGGASDSEDNGVLVVIWQQSNEENYSNRITTYGIPNIEIKSKLTASNGTAEIISSVTNKRTYYYTSETPGKTVEEPGEVDLLINSQYFSTSSNATSGTNIMRFDLNDAIISHGNMTTNNGYDFVTIRSVNKLNIDYYKLKTISVQNQKDYSNKITTYGDVDFVIGTGLIAAGGKASLTYSQVNTRTYYYTSGSISRTEDEYGDINISITRQTLSSTQNHGSTNISRFSINEDATFLLHQNMTNNITYDVVTVKATGEGGMTNTYTTYVKNVANASSAITEYGTPYVSIGSLYAYESETTVTYYANNKRTYYYTSGTAGTSEWEPASVKAEMTTNGNSRFTFTNPGLKHASMGKNATTDKVVIKVTNLDDPNINTNTASKSITNYADDYYGTPEITAYSYAVFSSTGGSKTPTVTYRQYSYYSSGSSCNTYTSGGTLQFKMSSTAGFTLNSTTTGKITVTANTTTDTRSAYPQVRVTMNGLTSSYYTTTRCIQEGLAEQYIIDDINLYFSAAKDSESFTVTYSYYVGGSYVSSGVLSSYTITEISDYDSAFSRSGSTITAKANESTSSRSATYQISASGYSNGYIYCYQDGDTVDYRIISLSSEFGKTSPCSAEGGSCTVTAKVTTYWVSGDITYTVPTLKSNNSALTVTSVNSSTYKATATWSANTGTSERSATITASYSGATSKTATLYQEGSVSIVKEWLTISSFTYDEIPPDGGSVTPTIGTITYHVNYSDGSNNSWTISKDQCSFTYSLDSTTDFTINTAGKVSSKSVNNSGMTRSAEVTCTCKWEGLSCEKQTTILQQSNYWYLYLVNASYENYQIALCTSGYSPDMHATSIINVDATSTLEIDITTGLDISYTDGATRLANNNESIYVWKKGDREFTFVGSFTYYSRQNISFGINK